jgi:hypothetical protein
VTLLLRHSEVSGLLDLPQAMGLLDLPQAMAVLEQTFREQAAGEVRQMAPLRFMNRGMRLVVGGLEAQDKNGSEIPCKAGTE